MCQEQFHVGGGRLRREGSIKGLYQATKAAFEGCTQGPCLMFKVYVRTSREMILL